MLILIILGYILTVMGQTPAIIWWVYGIAWFGWFVKLVKWVMDENK